MVQVLPYVPSFGEKLAPALAQAGVDIHSGFQKRRLNQQDQQLIDSFNPEDSPLVQIQKFARLSPERQTALSPLFSQFFKQSGQQQEIGRPLEETLGELQQIAENPNSKIGFFNILNKATEKGREDRAYFDELSLSIERYLADKVGKGTLSKQRFEYLKSKLPQSSDTVAKSKGKIRGLQRELVAEENKMQAREGKTGSKPPLESFLR